MKVFSMNNSTSSATIEKLRTTFATHGLPEKLVSDNGSCFTSEEFERFLSKNGIKHVKTAPYHPAANGLAERAVQTFKEGMKKLKEESIETKVSRFLFQYRITPQTTTGITPAELLMGRKPLSRLDLLNPDLKRRVESKQQDQKERHDSHAKGRSLKPEDLVYARNYAQGEKWIPGKIEERTGPVSFEVELNDNQRIRRHQDQVISRENNEVGENGNLRGESRENLTSTPWMEKPPTKDIKTREVPQQEMCSNPATSRLYPARERRRPNYYGQS